MGSSNIRDILTSFSPLMDFFAISTGDGRIKIWDTVKGQLQTEFADFGSTKTSSDIISRPASGHLSMDYKCMEWLSLEKKKKRKLGTSLLVLGTGSGDVLAVDVAAGDLKWRFNDCHPGGVAVVSSSANGSRIYTAGADGMVSELDYMSGNLLHKFRASAKAISSMTVSPDGKVIATASARLKVFNCLDHKKIQKFSGHPGAVRCMVFSDDGKYLLSSAVGERYVAIWRIDGSKKQSACCFLAMDHPAVFLDSRCISTGDDEDTGLCVLAISEMGVCYFWHGKNVQELQDSKSTKILVDFVDKVPREHKGSLPSIFAAKIQNVVEPSNGNVYLAYGWLMKPTFENILVQPGTDIKLSKAMDGILLPISQSGKSNKGSDTRNQVIALDRAAAQDALLPTHKIFNLVDEKSGVQSLESKDDLDEEGVKDVSSSMEDRLRALGIINERLGVTSGSLSGYSMLKDINLSADTPQKKMKATIVSMDPNEAYNLLTVLMGAWRCRSFPARFILPWICCILVNHNEYVVSQEPKNQLLDSLHKMSKSKESAIHSLLQLSGRLQLVRTQVDRATNNKLQTVAHVEQQSESEGEDVDEVFYGVDEESQTESDSDT